MENTEESNSQNTKNLNVAIWIVTVILVGAFSFFIGKASNDPKQNVGQLGVVVSVAPSPTVIPPTQSIPSPTVDLESFCDKSGPSQKKDYLVSYLLKEGDTFNKIAENELKDVTRVSELTTLNSDQRQLTVGSTVYLPPEFIKESSGNIFETSGKIVKKDVESWQITYGGGADGPGLWIPGFWFKDIPNINSFKIGDCVTILLDNGVKVYTVKKSS